MSDLIEQEHAITFTEVDTVNNKFISHFSLCIGKTYDEALAFFNQIKESYPKKENDPEFVIDFIDSTWSILDDYSLSKENAVHLASRMGHKLNV